MIEQKTQKLRRVEYIHSTIRNLNKKNSGRKKSGRTETNMDKNFLLMVMRQIQ